MRPFRQEMKWNCGESYVAMLENFIRASLGDTVATGTILTKKRTCNYIYMAVQENSISASLGETVAIGTSLTVISPGILRWAIQLSHSEFQRTGGHLFGFRPHRYALHTRHSQSRKFDTLRDSRWIP